MQRAFRTFIGVDLGGGKGKTTAVALLRLTTGPEGPAVLVEDYGGSQPWYDDRLIDYLLRHAGPETVLAIDAPLTLTACVRCTLPSCPGQARCEVPVVRWFRDRAGAVAAGTKPRYTPYTQRATEVHLHEEHGILPRETLGQGMGPLTARAVHLRRALSSAYTLDQNLLEVYPKATLAQLFPDGAAAAEPARAAEVKGIIYRDGNGRPLEPEHGTRPSLRRVENLPGPRGVPVGVPAAEVPADWLQGLGPLNEGPAGERVLRGHAPSRVARHYKRSGHAVPVRERILRNLPDLRFGPGQWREFALQNDHQIDALLCAYTAFLWARDGWERPADPVFGEDGWIWFPPQRRLRGPGT